MNTIAPRWICSPISATFAPPVGYRRIRNAYRELAPFFEAHAARIVSNVLTLVSLPGGRIQAISTGFSTSRPRCDSTSSFGISRSRCRV